MTGENPQESRAPEVPEMRVKRWVGLTKNRQFVRVNGVSPDVNIVPFNHNIDTLIRAVKERVFLVKENNEFCRPPRPAAGVFSSRLEKSVEMLSAFLPKTAPLNYQQFVDTYRGRKKGVYQKALSDLRCSRSTIEEDATVEVFIKYEKTDRTTKVDPVPRVISPRDAKYNLRVGRYLKRIEEKVFRGLGKLFGHKTVIKGCDAEMSATLLRQKWDMFKNPIAVGLDASRFDQHVSLDALKVEHSVYQRCFNKKDGQKLTQILSHQLVNRCVGRANDGCVEYTVEGTRMSGDMNTSLGNCVLMVLMIHSYLQHVGVQGQLANNGDDCVVFMERNDLDRFMTGLSVWFREMGFNMVVEIPVTEFEHIEFCQTKPVFDGKTWIMCRNPWTALAKDGVLLKDPSSDMKHNYFKLWARAVGVGGVRLSGGLPVLQNFYRFMQSIGHSEYLTSKGRRKSLKDVDGNEILPWYMRELGINGKRVFSEPTAEARASFWSAFDVTPDEQVELERYYDQLVMDFHVDNRFIPRDVFIDSI
nr:RNA polymerase [Flumine tombus-like virus 6]